MSEPPEKELQAEPWQGASQPVSSSSVPCYRASPPDGSKPTTTTKSNDRNKNNNNNHDKQQQDNKEKQAEEEDPVAIFMAARRYKRQVVAEQSMGGKSQKNTTTSSSQRSLASQQSTTANNNNNNKNNKHTPVVTKYKSALLPRPEYKSLTRDLSVQEFAKDDILAAIDALNEKRSQLQRANSSKRLLVVEDDIIINNNNNGNPTTTTTKEPLQQPPSPTSNATEQQPQPSAKSDLGGFAMYSKPRTTEEPLLQQLQRQQQEMERQIVATTGIPDEVPSLDHTSNHSKSSNHNHKPQAPIVSYASWRSQQNDKLPPKFPSSASVASYASYDGSVASYASRRSLLSNKQDVVEGPTVVTAAQDDIPEVHEGDPSYTVAFARAPGSAHSGSSGGTTPVQHNMTTTDFTPCQAGAGIATIAENTSSEPSGGALSRARVPKPPPTEISDITMTTVHPWEQQSRNQHYASEKDAFRSPGGASWLEDAAQRPGTFSSVIGAIPSTTGRKSSDAAHYAGFRKSVATLEDRARQKEDLVRERDEEAENPEDDNQEADSPQQPQQWPMADVTLADDAKKRRRKQLKMGLLAICCVNILMAIVLGMVLGVALPALSSSAGDKSSTPNAGEWTPEEVFVDNEGTLLLPTYTFEAIQVEGTPQFRAFDWLARDPNLDQYLVDPRRQQVVQRFSLAVLYFGTFLGSSNEPSDAGTFQLNYDTHECTWGVGVCQRYKYDNEEAPPPPYDESHSDYTELDLSSEALSKGTLRGMITSELSLLTALVILNMSDQDLKGPLPSELGLLSKLQWVFLQDNRLSFTLPSELSQWTDLQNLRLSANAFTGLGLAPAMVQQWTLLTSLDMSTNMFTGPIPKEMAALTRLNELRLEFNQLSGTIPSELGKIPGLVVLNVFANPKMTSPFPQEICANQAKTNVETEYRTNWCSNTVLKECCEPTEVHNIIP